MQPNSHARGWVPGPLVRREMNGEGADNELQESIREELADETESARGVVIQSGNGSSFKDAKLSQPSTVMKTGEGKDF